MGDTETKRIMVIEKSVSCDNKSFNKRIFDFFLAWVYFN